ncbi:MAG: Maf family protein [Candidatus Puniceispirillaceae bacterium]
MTRKHLLADAGIFADHVIAANIDETPIKNERPADYVLRMAHQKADAVANRLGGQFVLSADTAVICGQRILPKAETAEEARRCLQLLSGRSHRVYGGICLYLPDGGWRTKLSVSRVKFRPLGSADKHAYLQSGEWRGKAGGYAIQGRAGLYVRQITGSYSNIVGLDMHKVAGLLLGAGFDYVQPE